MIFLSLSINGIHMLKSYKMALKERNCVQPPNPKTFYQDVPGADGSLDLSDATAGRIVYERRIITLNFGCGYQLEHWPAIYSEIMKNFHGKIGKLIFDDDEGYYYTGRMKVTDYKRVQTLGMFTITVEADPYKYEIVSGDEDWLWDTLDFEDGMIREYGNISVDGTYNMIIDGTEKWTIPDIVVSEDMTVIFEGKEYQIKKGINKLYGIVIRDGEHTIAFRGKGTVSVKYRGAVL